eukprot:NODE_6643_length_350_cov_11.186047_g5917_i0.p2 GENE.NODE_6643_length_350_cov_11.186047_g5917_i0~~NODE_6643_length_350_cov_11.186047_g5917_i0.p2  ORF type:complete len:52 (+),score=3.05 NODE_6643_length_350_cov_11.186047_g5917_i0:164-319(+)
MLSGGLLVSYWPLPWFQVRPPLFKGLIGPGPFCNRECHCLSHVHINSLSWP